MIAKSLSPETRFGLRFFGLLLLSSTVFWWLGLHHALGPLQDLMASIGAGLGRAAGGTMHAQQDLILVGALTLHINHECTGIFVLMLFTSFVLAYPASVRYRLAGLLVGIPLFFAVNVVRIATLARIVEVYPDAFFYFHEYVWQGVFMVVVLVASIAWAERSR